MGCFISLLGNLFCQAQRRVSLNDQEMPSLEIIGSLPNRSLNLTPPRAEFFVRRKYILSPMLIDSEVSLTNSKNVTATAVHNGRRRLAPNR